MFHFSASLWGMRDPYTSAELSGLLSRRCRGLIPCVESGPKSELARRGKPPVYCHLDQGTCGFPSRLSQDAFPGGFPTRLSYVPPWCESILGVKVKAVQGKQFPLEWTETSGGLLEWRHEPGVALAFPVEFLSPFLWRAPPLEMGRGTPGIISRPRRERIHSLEL